ncbi:hypothetical protein [Niallia oryzisoli]|uniref:hypothetical protein n=1 Tax=Niallia oryzisoli TaxID=1737571 RepID=UPI003734C393
MAVITASVFSILIIFMTIYSMIKVFIIAKKRNEISLQKSIIYSALSITVGFIVASILPFGYQLVFDYVLSVI